MLLYIYWFLPLTYIHHFELPMKLCLVSSIPASDTSLKKWKPLLILPRTSKSSLNSIPAPSCSRMFFYKAFWMCLPVFWVSWWPLNSIEFRFDSNLDSYFLAVVNLYYGFCADSFRDWFFLCDMKPGAFLLGKAAEKSS